MNVYLRPILRFWWVVVLGLAVAAVAAVATVYRIEPGVPPKLDQRTKPVYYTSTQLVLQTARGDFIRTGYTELRPQPPRYEAIRDRDGKIIGQRAVPQKPQAEQVTPDVGWLVNLANVYPAYIESDAVRAIRDRLYGPMKGQISANGLFSVKTANKFRESKLPIIEISGSAKTEKGAINIVQATAKAFNTWLTASQDAAKPPVPKSQRVFLQQLQVPKEAFPTGSPSYGLAVLVGLVVAAGFAILAFLLNMLFPPRPREDEAFAEESEDELTARGAIVPHRSGFAVARTQAPQAPPDAAL